MCVCWGIQERVGKGRVWVGLGVAKCAVKCNTSFQSISMECTYNYWVIAGTLETQNIFMKECKGSEQLGRFFLHSFAPSHCFLAGNWVDRQLLCKFSESNESLDSWLVNLWPIFSNYRMSCCLHFCCLQFLTKTEAVTTKSLFIGLKYTLHLDSNSIVDEIGV